MKWVCVTEQQDVRRCSSGRILAASLGVPIINLRAELMTYDLRYLLPSKFHDPSVVHKFTHDFNVNV